MVRSKRSANVYFTSRKIDISGLLPLLNDPDSGGVVVFLGRTRRDKISREQGAEKIDGGLFYEAYRPLAEKGLNELARQATRRFGVRRIVITHRIGHVPVGEPSVLVAVASPHRKEAFEACRFLIDRLKEDIPIWKTSEASLTAARSRERGST